MEATIVSVEYCPAQQQLDNKYSMVIHIALNRTPNIDCYWVGAVPKVSAITRCRSLGLPAALSSCHPKPKSQDIYSPP